MPSSNRIIRGPQAAELPSWSVDLIGARYNTPVERTFAEVGHVPGQIKHTPPPMSEAEKRLWDWEQSLKQREAHIEQLEREALQRGHEQGQQSGYEAGWDAAHQERALLVQAAQTLETEFEAFKESLSEKLLELAVLVSKKIVADTVEVQSQQAGLILLQLMDSMQLDSKAITLKANAATIAVLEQQFGDHQMLGNLRMVEDPKQLQGGFVLHHPEGEVDATLQTRWLRAIEALGKNTPLQPGDLNTDEGDA
ncbi:FliH/SctL family protein [Limnobacter sp.]|uniref:FliH/SctL family protein n=1 Tax=Limnobacter sp. TaxID=2003368 RepID=UPI0035115E82